MLSASGSVFALTRVLFVLSGGRDWSVLVWHASRIHRTETGFLVCVVVPQFEPGPPQMVVSRPAWCRVDTRGMFASLKVVGGLEEGCVG